MSELPGATRTALVLRLSVPAAGGLRVVAADMAVKVAEYLGAANPDGQSITEALEQLSGRVAAGADGDIVFEFRRSDDELLIEATCRGRSAELRYPLPA